ncbi:hypothetical protein LLG46_06180 [bacterium]|nr:hypothetical protein [bacterium]
MSTLDRTQQDGCGYADAPVQQIVDIESIKSGFIVGTNSLANMFSP